MVRDLELTILSTNIQSVLRFIYFDNLKKKGEKKETSTYAKQAILMTVILYSGLQLSGNNLIVNQIIFCSLFLSLIYECVLILTFKLVYITLTFQSQI